MGRQSLSLGDDLTGQDVDLGLRLDVLHERVDVCLLDGALESTGKQVPERGRVLALAGLEERGERSCHLACRRLPREKDVGARVPQLSVGEGPAVPATDDENPVVRQARGSVRASCFGEVVRRHEGLRLRVPQFGRGERVVTIEATNTKTVIFAPSLLPDVAILDPVMTKTMPPFMTAATGMDALAHCIEAYAAIGDHPMADAIALGGIRLCRGALAVATESPDDLHARADMLKAAMMGAVAFQKGLGACHSLAHPLSTEFGLHHGLANAICLPAVLDYNRTVIPDRIAEIGRQLGVKGPDDNTLSFECAGAVRALRRSIGLPGDLRSQGIEETDLPKLAALAYKDVCHRLNPRPCTEEDLLALYKASLDDG